jgi:hypothetical protein
MEHKICPGVRTRPFFKLSFKTQVDYRTLESRITYMILSEFLAFPIAHSTEHGPVNNG